MKKTITFVRDNSGVLTRQLWGTEADLRKFGETTITQADFPSYVDGWYISDEGRVAQTQGQTQHA